MGNSEALKKWLLQPRNEEVARVVLRLLYVTSNAVVDKLDTL
jgi:hypothetical protein